MTTNKTLLKTMVVAIVAMIGMTGFALATTTTANYVGDGSYGMTYGGSGTGSMNINTWTSAGIDQMNVGWTNTNVNGQQDMSTSSFPELSYSMTHIHRNVTVGTGGTGQDASGYIQTYSLNGDNSVTSLATYHDDEADGSHVTTAQQVHTFTDGEFNSIFGDINIDGSASGNDTLVTGLVKVRSGSILTLADMKMIEGAFNLYTYISAPDGSTKLDPITMTGTGTGNATMAGFANTPAMADFSLDAINDAAGYHIDGNAENLTSMSFHDDFDEGYIGTGNIYVYNVTD